MITPGHPDGDGGRRKDLAEVIKALKNLPVQLPPDFSRGDWWVNFLLLLRAHFAAALAPLLPEVPVGPSEPATARTGYVLAWRQWGIDSRRDGAVHLMSLYDSTVWPQRAKLVATCAQQHFQNSHLPPEPLCSCGIYALKNGAAVQPSFSPTSAWGQESTTPIWALGKVALWGRVLEGEEGFRAQYAYPYALWTAGLTKDKRVALGDAYGVKVNQIDGNALKAIGNSGYEFVE